MLNRLPRSNRFNWTFLVALTVGVVALLTVGYLYDRNESARIREDKYNDIQTVGAIKTQEIVRWRNERLADANRLAKSPFLRESVAEFLRDSNNPVLRAGIRERLVIAAQEDTYPEVLLLDHDGNVLLSSKDHPEPVGSATHQVLIKSLTEQHAVFSSFYEAAAEIVRIDIVAPVIASSGGVLAVVVLHTDPAVQLFPMIRSWPTSSQSAESLLFYRSGEEVVYLAGSRTSESLSLHMPVSRRGIASVEAALGKRGLFQGKDYRNGDVLADLRNVTDSDWFLVTKLDTDELLHEAHYRTGMIATHVAVGILFAVALVILIHRQRQADLFRDLYESERERREAEQALSQSEERFKLMVQNASDVIGTINREGITTYVSPAITRLTGYEPEEMQMSVGQIVHPDDVQLVVKAFATLLEHPGSTDCLVYRIVCKDGSCKYVETVAQNCLDVPSVSGIVYNTRDVSEHRQSAQALRKNEELYRSLFDNMLNGFAYCRMLYNNDEPQDFIYLDVNESFEKLTGLRNAVGRRVSDVIPNIRETDAELFEIYGRVGLTGKPERFERYVEAMKMWFSISVYSPNKEHFVAVFDVITERKHAESVLQASEARFRSIFDQVTDGILIADPGSKTFVMTNRAMCEMLGYSEQELLLSQFSDIHPDAELLVLETTLLKLSSGESQVVNDLPFKQKDGSVLFADVNFTSITIGDRNLMMGSVRDVTEKRALQASVAQADRLASMGMLAAGVAHEINNPLSYVLYNVESLVEDLPRLTATTQRCCSALRERLGDTQFLEIAGDGAELLQPTLLAETAERAREALAGGQRIKVIARGLGTFSRVEHAEQSRVDIKFPIECAINMSFNEIKYRARLVKDFGPAPAVLASEGKLSQVFLNLLINAAHAIGEGHAEQNRIGIRTWTEDDNVFAEISDTGKGIPRENLERIFDPFFTTKPAGVGSGLGLAICKNIVTEFGGDIQVDSEIGKGTRFVVRLPVQRQLPETQGVTTASANHEPPYKGGRILVVDDEPLIRSAMRRILGREHEVITAASGEEGRTLLERDSSFDVILCDLMMPNMSGMELHEWVANRNPALARRVLFLTGGAYTPWASEYVANVGNLRIEKPVDSALLKRIVMQQVLERRKNRDSGRAGSSHCT